MALISQTDIEARLGRSLSASEQSTFAIINPALQRHVDEMIGSSVETTSASTRYYHGGVMFLSIDPCTDVTTVTQVDDDDVVIYTYDPSDYTIFPKNSTIKRQVIHRRSPFVTGIYNIAVTAKFSIAGDATIQKAVKNAMLEALASELDNSDNVYKESIEGYSVEFARSETKDALEAVRYLFPEV